MLRQTINLYTSFKTSSPKIKHLSWRQLVLGSAAFIFLLILSYIFDISDFYYQKYRLTSLNNDIARLQAQIETKKTLYPSFFFSDNVASIVSSQEKSMRLEAQLLEKIANRILFSDIMQSLGLIDVTDVWLSEINIEEGGSSIKLTGNALTMPDLKSYFAQIEKNDFFKNDHLTLNNVEHTPKESYPDFQTYVISIAKTQNEKANS